MSTVSTNMLQLPVAVAVDGSEWMWIVQGGTDKRVPVGVVMGGGGGSLISRVITAAGNVTVGDTDNQIFMAQTAPQAVDIILPVAEDKVGNVYISDTLGVSGSFNFRLVVAGGVQTIAGMSEYLLNNNYQSIMLRPVLGVGYVP